MALITRFTPKIYNAICFLLTWVGRLSKGEKVQVRDIAILSNLKTTFYKMEKLKESIKFVLQEQRAATVRVFFPLGILFAKPYQLSMVRNKVLKSSELNGCEATELTLISRNPFLIKNLILLSLKQITNEECSSLSEKQNSTFDP